MGSVRKYMWVVHLVVIAACSWFAAQAVTAWLSTFFEGKMEVARPEGTAVAAVPPSPIASEGAYDVIAERNIFNSEESAAEALPPEEMGQKVDLSGEPTKTNLNIKVLGTLMVGDGTDERSSATVVGGTNREADVYFIKGREAFEEGVELIKVLKDRIVFVNKGRLEYAMLEGVVEELTIFASAAEVHGGGEEKPDESVAAERATAVPGEDKFVLEQKEVDEALTHLDRLYTEIRIVPNYKDGQTAGFKVLAIKPGSIFSKLGILRGDVLERVNGMELNIRNGMELFNKLKDQKNLRIDLVRNGTNKTIEYEIK